MIDNLISLVVDKGRLYWTEIIKPEWIDDEVNAGIWKKLVLLKREYGKLPSREGLVSFLDEREVDRLSSFSEIRDNDVSLVEKVLLDYVEDKMVQEMLEKGADVFSLKGSKGVWKVIEDVRRRLGYLSLFSEDGQYGSIFDKERIVERFLSREKKQNDGVYTMIPSLDKVIGGFRKGTLTVVMGVTSVGKTMFLVYLSSAALFQGNNVLFISLEDSKDTVEERFDMLWFGCDENLDESISKKKKYVGDIGSLFLCSEDLLSLDMLEKMVVSYLEKGVSVVVVDYGDLMVSGKTMRDDFSEMGAVFEGMMKIAKKYDLTMITATQASRESLGTLNVTLKQISRSFRKAQTAHYVLALSQTQEEEESGYIRIVVLKNKFGRRNITIPCFIDRERQYFREVF